MPHPTAAVDLHDVTVVAGERPIVDGVTWRVERGERWVILGANGSGKTTLLHVAGARRFPSRGRAWVLGEELGRTDMRSLRARIGFAGAGLADDLRRDIRVVDAVMTARYGALEPWWHSYTDADRAAAQRVLEVSRVETMAGRPLDTLSQGERQRVLVARAFMADAGLVILDEPAAGLDFVSRELLVGQVAALAAAPDRATVLVTHHLEEVPPTVTHALLMRDGRAVAQGPVDDVVTAAALSECFGTPIAVERRPGGRWSAWVP